MLHKNWTIKMNKYRLSNGNSNWSEYIPEINSLTKKNCLFKIFIEFKQEITPRITHIFEEAYSASCYRYYVYVDIVIYLIFSIIFADWDEIKQLHQ